MNGFEKTTKANNGIGSTERCAAAEVNASQLLALVIHGTRDVKYKSQSTALYSGCCERVQMYPVRVFYIANDRFVEFEDE